MRLAFLSPKERKLQTRTSEKRVYTPR